jgi:hypothetical protein
LSTLTPSRPRRLLAILTITPGILAASVILATLVLLAVDGHPEGVLTAAVGATVPVMLRGARHLPELARSARSARSARAAHPSHSARLTIKLEPTSARPTTTEIRGPRILAPS